jgi:cytochrome c biogenesis protein CcdA
VAPILAAVAAFAFSTGGFLSAFLAFLLFACTMAALMLVMALFVALARPALVRRVRASTPAIQRIASVVLVLIGAGMVYFTLNVQTFRSLFIR